MPLNYLIVYYNLQFLIFFQVPTTDLIDCHSHRYCHTVIVKKEMRKSHFAEMRVYIRASSTKMKKEADFRPSLGFTALSQLPGSLVEVQNRGEINSQSYSPVENINYSKFIIYKL